MTEPDEARAAARAVAPAPRRAPDENEPRPIPSKADLAPTLETALYRLAGRRYTVPVVIALLIGVVCMLNHFHGIDWGDDFALYMRQAKALNIGNIGEVIHDNRYTVDNSGWHTFSPYLYPWGWPLLVAPVYAMFGLNYGAIKVVEVAALCVFLVFFYDLVRRRAGAVAATVLVLLIGLSPSYVTATDGVLSDLPYLCFVGLSLWWLDRCRREGILECSRRQLIALGLLVAFTFNIRREGITLLAAVAALQITVLAGMALRARSVRLLREVRWQQVLLPYEIFACAAVAFQLLLPTQVLPPAPGAGVTNVYPNLVYFWGVLAENVGLKATGQAMRLFHNQVLAEVALAVLVALAVIGIAARLVRRFEEDIPLVAYLICMSLVVLVSPYQESRYLDTITPFIVYFAYQSLPALSAVVEQWSRPRMARRAAFGAAVAFAGLALLNAQATAHSTDYHLHYHLTTNGPDTPAAQQMFAAVKRYTRGDDVILFFRARAMTLYTDRVALQGTNLDQMLPQVDWYVMEKGSTYSQPPLTDTEAATHGLTKVWENSGWVLWRVPPRAG